MSDVNSVLNERLQKKEKSEKMVAMAQKSARGDLTGFAGIFGTGELSDNDQALLQDILHRYAIDNDEIQVDLKALIHITSEVKAITNQAAILHGERIARAHEILIRYREGAFTSWLIATYGNRQTPYNLWRYYQFYQAIPKELRPQMEAMPRQAIYTLASREGSFETKQRIVSDHSGATKSELLKLIREQFPLDQQDQRAQNPAEGALRTLEQLYSTLKAHRKRIGPGQRRELLRLLHSIAELVGG